MTNLEIVEIIQILGNFGFGAVAFFFVYRILMYVLTEIQPALKDVSLTLKELNTLIRERIPLRTPD